MIKPTENVLTSSKCKKSSGLITGQQYRFIHEAAAHLPGVPTVGGPTPTKLKKINLKNRMNTAKV